MRNKDGDKVGPIMNSLLSQDNILKISPRAKGTNKLSNVISFCFNVIRMDKGVYTEAGRSIRRLLGDQASMVRMEKSGWRMPISGYRLSSTCTFYF